MLTATRSRPTRRRPPSSVRASRRSVTSTWTTRSEPRTAPTRRWWAKATRWRSWAKHEKCWIGKFCNIFANLWRARSRLYQNQILQWSMRLTAFFKLYKICTLLHRCDLKILAKHWFEKSTIFVKIQHFFLKGYDSEFRIEKSKFSNIFCKCCKNCKIVLIFKKISYIIW